MCGGFIAQRLELTDHLCDAPRVGGESGAVIVFDFCICEVGRAVMVAGKLVESRSLLICQKIYIEGISLQVNFRSCCLYLREIGEERGCKIVGGHGIEQHSAILAACLVCRQIWSLLLIASAQQKGCQCPCRRDPVEPCAS